MYQGHTLVTRNDAIWFVVVLDRAKTINDRHRRKTHLLNWGGTPDGRDVSPAWLSSSPQLDDSESDWNGEKAKDVVRTVMSLIRRNISVCTRANGKSFGIDEDLHLPFSRFRLCLHWAGDYWALRERHKISIHVETSSSTLTTPIVMCHWLLRCLYWSTKQSLKSVLLVTSSLTKLGCCCCSIARTDKRL